MRRLKICGFWRWIILDLLGQKKSRLDLVIGLGIVFLFLAVNIATIEEYGIGTDAGRHMFRGEVLLHLYLTGETDYSNLPADERCRFQEIDPDYELLTPDFFLNRYHGKNTIGGLSSALTCLIFHKRLGWLGALDAHNLALVIFGALTILIVYLFALEAFGRRVAILSSVFLALYPPFIGYTHVTVKDMPVVFFVSATIWSFWKGVVHKSYKWVWLSVIFLGMALVSKMTGAYALIILGAWGLALFCFKQKVGIFSLRSAKFWGTLLLSPLVVMLVYLLFAPTIWYKNPYDLGGNIVKTANQMLGTRHFVITKKTSLTAGKTGAYKDRWQAYYAPTHGLLTIPLPILFFALFGGWYAVKKRREEAGKDAWLVLIWATAPVLFCTLPYLHIYDSIREFLAYIPGICLLAGIGTETFYSWLKPLTAKYLSPAKVPTVYAGCLALMIASEAISVLQYHPYEITFFNSLVGGLKGAQNIQIPFTDRVGIPAAADFQGTSLRNAVKWLNRHAVPGSIVVFHREEKNKFLPLKKGIRVLPFRWDREESKREVVKKMAFDTVYLAFINIPWNRTHPLFGYCYQKLSPVYTIKANGAPISWIYQMPREEFLRVVFPPESR